MNSESLISTISDGECFTTEFKLSFDKEAIETVSAFSNSKGGYLLIGIKDNRAVCGVKIGNESIQNTINQMKNSTEPSLIVDIEVIEIENKTISAIKVDEGVKTLYELIKLKPNNRATFFANELQTSGKNIERWLKQLKSEDKIEFQGATKTGGYVVK